MGQSRRPAWGPLLIGVLGTVILVSLGIWQAQRLVWKEALIERVESRVDASPVGLAATPDPATDDYLPVVVTGRFDHSREQLFLTSQKPYGPGYALLTPFQIEDGREIVVDRGYVPQDRVEFANRPDGEVMVTGLLRWPNEIGPFTPEPVAARREWYARNIDPLAAALGTAPLLVVEMPTGAKTYPRGTPAEVDLPNNHLQYAGTWFSLAIVWAVMSFVWLRRRGAARSQG